MFTLTWGCRSGALSQIWSNFGSNVYTQKEKKEPNYSYLCMHDKHCDPALWLMFLICSSLWSSVAFGIQKDVGAAATTFVWKMGQRREAVPQQLSENSKLCTTCTIFHQVIMKAGPVASPTFWNDHVHQHKHAIDQTCDAEVFVNGSNL